MNTVRWLQLALMFAGAALFVGALWFAFALILSFADYIPSSLR